MAARDGKPGTLRGADLERRVGRVEFMSGSLVRLRHPVVQLLEGRRRDVTDVDVLALDFDARLRTHVSIAECKSVRGQAGEQDRLLWLSGLGRLVGADSASLVRESVSNAGREIARALNLDILAASELTEREAMIVHVPEAFGSLSGPHHDAARREASAQAKKIGDLPAGLVAYLRHDALLAQPHRALGALLTLDEVSRTGTVLPEPLGRLLAGDALVALVLAALRVGNMTDTLSLVRLRTELELGIGTGDPGDRQLIQFAEMADQLLHTELSTVHRAYREAGATPQERPVPSVRQAIAQAPPWLERFIDLAARMRRRSSISRTLPQTLDLLLYDRQLGGAAWQDHAFDHLFTRDHRQLLAVANECLQAALPELASRLDLLAGVRYDRAPTPGVDPPIKGSSAGDQHLDRGSADQAPLFEDPA